jgi:hypothetical protein
LWEVEIAGTQRRSRDYELLEQFLERGIAEGDMHSTAELATFFGMDDALVAKALFFLRQMGHVEGEDGSLSLTGLGRDSLADGVSYQKLKTHRKLYFEAFGSSPLPRDHYRLRILSAAEALSHPDRRYFLAFSFHYWRPESLPELAQRPDRAKWNLPDEIYNIQSRAVTCTYLPLYIIETRDRLTAAHHGLRYVVLSRIQDLRDQFFEEVINAEEDLLDPLHAQAEPNIKHLMEEDLAGRGLSGQQVRLEQLAPDAWRATVAAEALSSQRIDLTLAEVGTYLFVRGYCLQVWCDDPAFRREAALDQALAVISRWKRPATQQDVEQLLETVATRLQTQSLGLADLQQRAVTQGVTGVLAKLEELEV